MGVIGPVSAVPEVKASSTPRTGARVLIVDDDERNAFAAVQALEDLGHELIVASSGKEALRQELKNAINNALTIREGFGGIDDVYFTSFVTQ